MTYYTVVDANGYVKLSMITDDPNYSLETGERLLPDNPPDPRKNHYTHGLTKPIRVEPVPANALEIPYIIVEDYDESAVENFMEFEEL